MMPTPTMQILNDAPPVWAPWRATITQQPRAFAPFLPWLRLLWRYGGIDAPYWARALFVTVVSALSAPFRIWERWLHEPRVRRTRIKHPPIFILGHWRGGTTALHYCLARDPRIGAITMAQAAAPGLCLTGGRALRTLMGALAPSTRPMDDLPLSMDTPQEEELALANWCEFSFYDAFAFPGHARALFDAFVLFEGPDAPRREVWREKYLDILRKGTVLAGGRRLVLKNPVNTARIPELLALFPDARFIHIHRDPYEVYDSTRKLWDRVFRVTTVQRFDAVQLESDIVYFYQRLIQRYLADRALVPAGHLVEVRYESFATNPMAALEQIYGELALGDFEATRPSLQAECEHLADRRGAQREPSPATVARVNAAWGFAFDAFGYPRRAR